MMRFLTLFLLSISFGSPAAAFTANTGFFDGLEFVAETQIPAADGTLSSLCYAISDLRLFGLTISSSVTGYALSSDGCTAVADRPFSTEQMRTAQSLNLVDANLPPVAENSWQRVLRYSGIWIAVGLGMLAIIIRRIKSLFGVKNGRPMRKKAFNKILTAMCYAGRADGLVDSKDIGLISKTVYRLTNREVKANEVIRITDHLDPNLTEQEFINLGNGLRDSEKDIMMRGAFFVTIADGRLMPSEYEFITNLAHGIGMPGEDFRRVMNLAMKDMDAYGR